MENSMEVPPNIKNKELLFYLTILLLVVYPKEIKSVWQRDIYAFLFIATLFAIAKM